MRWQSGVSLCDVDLGPDLLYARQPRCASRLAATASGLVINGPCNRVRRTRGTQLDFGPTQGGGCTLQPDGGNEPGFSPPGGEPWGSSRRSSVRSARAFPRVLEHARETAAERFVFVHEVHVSALESKARDALGP